MLFFSGCQQKDSIAEFRKNHPVEIALTFYPSTLRMVNAKNEEYHQLIQDVEKGRYFKVNKRDDTQQAIRTLTAGLLEEGYEEVMTVKGNTDDMTVYALDHPTPVMIIMAEREKEYVIIQVQGMIHIARIPQLLNNFNEEEFLNIFSMYDRKKPQQNIEPDTANSQPE